MAGKRFSRSLAVFLFAFFTGYAGSKPALTEGPCVGSGATGHHYNCVSMLDNYIEWDRANDVVYLSELQKKGYELYVLGGKLVSCDGTPFDTSDARTAHSSDTRAIYVLDGGGRIFASKGHEMGKFHHSSFVGGRPVAAAGGIKVEDGELRVVSNFSGHYKPPAEIADQLLDELRRRGIVTEIVSRDFHPESFVNARTVDCKTGLP